MNQNPERVLYSASQFLIEDDTKLQIMKCAIHVPEHVPRIDSMKRNSMTISDTETR